MNDTIRWWIGELLLEMGRLEEAELYFESFWNDPLAADRLAGIYEQLGDRAKAREAHALVGSAWKDADPVLQPRARAARAAVQRLASARRYLPASRWSRTGLSLTATDGAVERAGSR